MNKDVAANEQTAQSSGGRSDARRRHLLETAHDLFAEKGFHQTGIAQIAKASGIKVGQIYRDFANKEAIIAAICETKLVEWLEEDKLAAALAANDRSAIRDWIRRFVDHRPTAIDRRLMTEILAEVARNPFIAESNRRAETRVRGNLMAALRSWAPNATDECRKRLINFMFVVSWGTLAWIELCVDQDEAALHKQLDELLAFEIERIGGNITVPCWDAREGNRDLA